MIVKGGGAIEGLGRARTRAARQDRHAHARRTRGRARSWRSTASAPTSCCASPPRVDQLSAHVHGGGARARRRGARPALSSRPTTCTSEPGEGIEGRSRATVWRSASRGFAARARRDGADGARRRPATRRAARASSSASTGSSPASIVMADRAATDAAAAVAALRAAGVPRRSRWSPATDRASPRRSARRVGVDRVYADCAPEEKLEVVRALRDDPAAAGRDGRRRRQRRAGAGAGRRRRRDGRPRARPCPPRPPTS